MTTRDATVANNRRTLVRLSLVGAQSSRLIMTGNRDFGQHEAHRREATASGALSEESGNLIADQETHAHHGRRTIRMVQPS
jgi:hypothetical protein